MTIRERYVRMDMKDEGVTWFEVFTMPEIVSKCLG
jgi:hypothetical protein